MECWSQSEQRAPQSGHWPALVPRFPFRRDLCSPKDEGGRGRDWLPPLLQPLVRLPFIAAAVAGVAVLLVLLRNSSSSSSSSTKRNSATDIRVWLKCAGGLSPTPGPAKPA